MHIPLRLVQSNYSRTQLECSEELGDMIKPVSAKYALSVYLRADAPAKVTNHSKYYIYIYIYI